MKSKFKNDLLLTGAILVIALVAFVCFKFTQKSGNSVNVSINGDVVKTFSLNENTEFEIKTGENVNILVISNGEAYIKSANCPDKICVHHRKISNDGETIVCLPHKVVISVESDN